MMHTSARLGLDQPAVYQIRIHGELDADWADWLDDGKRVSSIVITTDCGITTLTGTVADQPALFGLLSKIRDLSVALLSVDRVEAGASPA